MLRLYGAGAMVTLLVMLMSPAVQAAEYWYPTVGGDATWAFEDLWPDKGDYDFNDVVVRYRLHALPDGDGKITQMNVRMRFVARGASKASGFAVMLPDLPAGTTASATLGCNNAALAPEALDPRTFVVVADTATVLPAPAGCDAFTNTSVEAGCAPANGAEVLLKLHFNPAVPLATVATGLNPFLFRVGEPGREVHLPGFAPSGGADPSLFGTGDALGSVVHYTDVGGRPWALDIPGPWNWPIETTDITGAYKKFTTWVQSAGRSEITWWDTLESGAQDAEPDTTWDATGLSITGACDNCADVFCPSPQVCVEGVCQDQASPQACMWNPDEMTTLVFDSYDSSYEITIDASGNRYWCDGAWVDEQNYYSVLHAVTPNGDALWSHPPILEATGVGAWGDLVTTDTSGNIYVVGGTRDSFPGFQNQGEQDVFVTKFNQLGEPQWTSQFGSENNDSVSAAAVSPDGSSVVVVMGGTWLSDTALLMKLSSGGLVQGFMLQSFEGLRVLGMTVDAFNHALIVGTTSGVLPGCKNVSLTDCEALGDDNNVLIRVDLSTRETDWIRQWGTLGGDTAYEVGADASGNVFVASYDNDAFAFTRFDASGNFKGTTYWGDAWPEAMTVTPDGKVFVVGEACESLNGGVPPAAYDCNAYASLWDSNGVLERSWQWGDSSTPLAVALDSSNNLLVAGEAGNSPFMTRIPCASSPVSGCDLGVSDCDPLAHEVCVDTAEAWTCECITGYDEDVGGSRFVQVDGSDSASFAIKLDGTLWAWGYNPYGKLGLGDVMDRSVRTQVGSNATHWASVAVGSTRVLAIQLDGSLWAWGDNRFGLLGLGDISECWVPMQLGFDKDWASVAGGYAHSLAIKSHGTLWAWGSNWSGQLGLGDQVDRLVPTQVDSGTNWASVAGGFYYSLAIKADGTLWAWGYNALGQLGLDDIVERLVPTQVGSGTNWASVAAGNAHALAIKLDGTLWAWGSNSSGQLGLGDQADRLVPTQVGSDTNWASVATEEGYTLAIKADGTLWAWGWNAFGQLGLGNQLDCLVPTKVGNDTDWTRVAAGNSHALAIKLDGTLWTWGYNDRGQLGRETPGSYWGLKPRPIPTCMDIDECILLTDLCDDHATCTNTQGGYTCACNDEYAGDGFECHFVGP